MKGKKLYLCSMKKYLASILSIYILILSVSFCPDACNVESDECQTEQHDCTDCCSPFSICNTCVGFVVKDIVSIATHSQEISTEINIYQLQIHTNASLDGIWQPPKSA
jgi:hypothetical protein